MTARSCSNFERFRRKDFQNIVFFTVSRRSEPSSRTALIGEQPNPWDLLQPQDAMSRHRGAEPPRRCGRLGETSLFTFLIRMLPFA